MFWISITAVSAAAALIQLGVLAITVQILKALLAVAIAVELCASSCANMMIR